MKNTFTILFLLILSNLIYSQQVKKKIIVKKVEPITIYKNLYHLETGEKITKKEFDLLVKDNGTIRIEPLYNKYGEVEKQYYNPNPRKGEKRNSINKKPEREKLFPDFILKTNYEKKIQLVDLKGKLIIISFGLIIDGVWANKREMVELDSKINASNRSSEIESIILFRESKEEILKIFDLNNTNFKLIPNGEGFIKKWNITRFPTTLLIDKEGKFINNFKWYDINISEFLE